MIKVDVKKNGLTPQNKKGGGREEQIQEYEMYKANQIERINATTLGPLSITVNRARPILKLALAVLVIGVGLSQGLQLSANAEILSSGPNEDCEYEYAEDGLSIMATCVTCYSYYDTETGKDFSHCNDPMSFSIPLCPYCNKLPLTLEGRD